MKRPAQAQLGGQVHNDTRVEGGGTEGSPFRLAVVNSPMRSGSVPRLVILSLIVNSRPGTGLRTSAVAESWHSDKSLHRNYKLQIMLQ